MNILSGSFASVQCLFGGAHAAAAAAAAAALHAMRQCWMLVIVHVSYMTRRQTSSTPRPPALIIAVTPTHRYTVNPHTSSTQRLKPPAASRDAIRLSGVVTETQTFVDGRGLMFICHPTLQPTPNRPRKKSSARSTTISNDRGQHIEIYM